MGWSIKQGIGLTHHDEKRTCKGYTLVTPVGSDNTLLLDMAGRVVHRWVFEEIKPFNARLLDNGNLLALGTDASIVPPRHELGEVPPPVPDRYRIMGGGGTHLLELDWDGNEVWRYESPGIHHDFVRLANGNTIVPVWVEMPEAAAKPVRGGLRRPREKYPPMISDDFLEIDPAGNEVARLHLWELLDPRLDPICPLERKWEWTHTNSLDLTRDGHLLFSCRQNSRVGIIDRDKRELLWKYGYPDVVHQHHASALPNGNVQIFDNGMHRPAEMSYSRIVEVDPSNSSIVWEYAAQPREQFFSGHISGAERQSNGNTLICEGTVGRVFEVTSRGEVVWEWISPFVARRGEADISWIFRAHRYGLDHAALIGRSLDASVHAEFNQLHDLGGPLRRRFR